MVLARDDSPPVVGITGTSVRRRSRTHRDRLRCAGKKVRATAGNFNNEIGIPLTVLSADPRTEVLVLEMGATHNGDIAHLCGIAPPEVGVLTAVSPVHLTRSGASRTWRRRRASWQSALPSAVVSVSPVAAPEAADRGRANPAAAYHLRRLDGAAAELNASGVEVARRGLRVRGSGRESSRRGPDTGLRDAPGGAAAGGARGWRWRWVSSWKKCARGLTRLRRTGLRGEVYRLRDDIVVYDDSYNASPAAVAAVLGMARSGPGGQDRRLVAVLGGMFELGAGARAYHREAGGLAGEVGVGPLVCVGDEARWYAETFPGTRLFYEAHRGGGGGARERQLRGGDYVVVKGSRGVGLDRLTRKLKERLALV